MPQPLPPASAALALAEAKAYLRIHQAADDTLLTDLLNASYMMCERYTGRALIARDTTEIIPASSEWRRLTKTPAAAITAVEALFVGEEPVVLPVDAYAIDIDANGDGWVRVMDAGDAKRVRVSLTAGWADDWTAIAEPMRTGMIRFTAHLFANRDDVEDAPPGIVAALWRPWRRMRLI